ncbi:hypothetical protein K4K49_004292 [Colletotrichum sp. SAR 10_70]|nr:hypothetical protein KHU50_007244 [Colletotrichum sp. SAR 10_65]KAI8171327.1 hypothetical protein K4K49_004292 [Colletotrichum sp. SAR 10_70]
MQANRGNAEALGRKAKLARSYQELLDEFANKDLSSVGNYTLGRLIGKGSFGKVYLATHKLTNGSKVVLKSANKGDSNLAREIHHHRQFVHPHIARLYEVIVTENLVWLVLEYCAGDELYNYLLEHGPLPVHKVQKIFAQLVGAVSYVHQQSCVHRDLKLENILFDKHENVKLVDFGFTREYEGKSNHLQTFCGTICYSAPEMLKGEKYAGEKVDVWSLGVILYALLCGELPFDDDDDNVTRTKILSEEPKFPEHLPLAAIPLIKSLLSKRPLLRPSLPEILSNPFLAEHAPAQHAILKLTRPPPFATVLEKETLQRMRSAGVDIDSVIESVLAQRCDALAGWWTLLIEKEERKVRRRERKRREREAENRSLRRLSAASSRLDRIAPVLQEVDEDGGLTNRFIRLEDAPITPRTRGRSERRSAHYSDFNDLPGLPEHTKENGSPNTEEPPPPIDKDSIRSAKRPAEQQKVRKKPSQAIIAHWKNWTHWFFENTRRGRHANKRGSHSTPNLVDKNGGTGGSSKHSKDTSPRPQTSRQPTADGAVAQAKAGLPRGVVANAFPSNIRLVRGPGPPAPLALFNEGMPSASAGMQAPGSPNPFAQGGGILFAKRKRNIFKGPMLAFGGANASGSTTRSTSSSHSRSASASGMGRRSGEAPIQEEEEGEEAEEEVEEVDAFSPVVGGPGERIEERIYEEGETPIEIPSQTQAGSKSSDDVPPKTPKTPITPITPQTAIPPTIPT